MKMLLRVVAAATVATVLALPVVAPADEPQNYEADARQSGDSPPTIPHKVADDATGESCNACHREGVNGAPQTSHPERLGCTQCHVPGQVKTKKPPKKGTVGK